MNHGTRSTVANNFSMCQICNSVEHVATICLRIGDFTPKSSKCSLLHMTQNCGIICGYCSRMSHVEYMCWKKQKDVKTPTNNYFKIMVDVDVTTLE